MEETTMRTQTQPLLDSPAVEQRPMVDRMVNGARQAQKRKSNIFWAVFLSYVISVSIGCLIIYLVNLVFGTPYHEGLIKYDSTVWKLGIPLALISALLLGLFLPIIIARHRKITAVFVTIFLQFLTLVILVIFGLMQLSHITYLN